MPNRLQLHAEPSETLVAVASLLRTLRSKPETPWGDLEDSLEASVRRIHAACRELARCGRKCSPNFSVHVASVARRYPELSGLVICRGVIVLDEADPACLLLTVSLLEAANRLEGYVIQIRLDGTLLSPSEAVAAIHNVLNARQHANRPSAQAGRGPSCGEAQQGDPRSGHRRRRTAPARDDAASAMQFFLDITGLEIPATREQLNRALRAGVRSVHPDLRPGDATAHGDFIRFKRGFDELMRGIPRP